MRLSIKKILVPTDFSEVSLCALDYAANIARVAGAEIILLHVFESYQDNTKMKQPLNMKEIVESGIEDQLEEVKSQNKNLWGLKLRSKVMQGKIHQQIQVAAKHEKIDLIVMGTHGVSGIGDISKFFLGSNAYRTVANAPCPILTVREAKKNIRFKDIVLPFDNSKESKLKVDFAIEWAKLFESTIHLLALTAVLDELTLTSEISKLKKLVGEVETKLKNANIPYHVKMMRNKKISSSVIDYAKKSNADIIFIVTGKVYAINEILGASTQKNIITDSHVPVLSLHLKR